MGIAKYNFICYNKHTKFGYITYNIYQEKKLW